MISHEFNRQIHDNTTAAYASVILDLLLNYDFICSPRGKQIREIINYSFAVKNPTRHPIVTRDHDRNLQIEEYTKAEFELYESGTNQLSDFKQASKFWGNVAMPDGTVNSAYGYLIYRKKSLANPKFSDECLTPWDWAKQSLVEDKDSRQAVLLFTLPETYWRGSKDITCTIFGQFLIRADRLYFSITMRSNDVWRGLTYDLPWFCHLQESMRLQLLPTYPNLKLGYYYHTAVSMHLYDEHVEAATVAMRGKKTRLAEQ